MSKRSRKGVRTSSSSQVNLDRVQLEPSDLRDRFNLFKNAKHYSPRYYLQREMEEINCHDEIVRLCANGGILPITTMEFPVHPALTCEFLCSYSMQVDTESLIGTMSFRLGNMSRTLTIAQLNEILGFAPNLERSLVSAATLNTFWYKMTGNATFMASKSLSADIVNPCFRIIQRLLSWTIFARFEQNKVKLGELMVLESLVTGRPINIGYELACHLQYFARKPSNHIAVGGMITALAIHFQVDLSRYTCLPLARFDIPHLTSTKMIKIVDSIPHLIMRIGENPYRPFSHERMSTLDPLNWYERWTGLELPYVEGMIYEDGDDEVQGDQDDEDRAHDDENNLPCNGQYPPDSTGWNVPTDTPFQLADEFRNLREDVTGLFDRLNSLELTHQKDYRYLSYQMQRHHSRVMTQLDAIQQQQQQMWAQQQELWQHIIGHPYQPPPPPPHQ